MYVNINVQGAYKNHRKTIQQPKIKVVTSKI